MLYKNWSEICEVEDVHLRLAVALSVDQEFLGKIAQGFPNLFTETKPDRVGPFPLSYLKQLADIWCAQDGEDRSTLDKCFKKVGLPSILWAHPEADVFQAKNCLVLNVTDEQYAELLKHYQEGICFPYIGQTVVVDNTSYYTGWVNSEGTGHNFGKDITLFPANLVNVNA